MQMLGATGVHKIVRSIGSNGRLYTVCTVDFIFSMVDRVYWWVFAIKSALTRYDSLVRSYGRWRAFLGLTCTCICRPFHEYLDTCTEDPINVTNDQPFTEVCYALDFFVIGWILISGFTPGAITTLIFSISGPRSPISFFICRNCGGFGRCWAVWFPLGGFPYFRYVYVGEFSVN